MILSFYIKIRCYAKNMNIVQIKYDFKFFEYAFYAWFS